MTARPRSKQPGRAAALQVRLLGELTLLRDGRVLPLPASKKTRALLAYLIATERAHTRESLCDLLWEGPDDPRAALRWSLAKLRPLLDDGGARRLIADRERVAFEAHGARIDVRELQALSTADGASTADAATLDAAADSLRGELLDGLELPDCYRYSEWCRAEREAARRLARTVRSALVERHDAAPEVALVHARALVAADPLDQGAHVAVMRLLARLGRHKDALRQYETCRQILATESGARPSALLESARAQLGAAGHAVEIATSAPGDAPNEAAPIGVPHSEQHASETPFVGRAPECAALAEMVRGHGAARALLVLGEPGVGKTRLLAELARMMREARGHVLHGRAFEAEMIRPYGPWIDALRDLGPPDPFADPRAAPDGADERTRLFAAVVSRLQALGSEHPVLIVLDDIHWIDEASAALIHYAVRALDARRVRIACGARPGELGDNFAARRLVRALTREGQLQQVGLSPLGRDDTAALVRMVASDVDAARVFDESGGNPLFALEVARALHAGAEVSGSLEALLRDRLDQLQGSAAEALAWAAAFGGPFSSDLLMRVSGLDAPALVRAADELERRGFIRPAQIAGGVLGYDFAHDLMRRAAYHAVSEPRRRLMHMTIARALAALPEARDALAGDLAHHAALGGDDELAANACLTAAERCTRLFANDEGKALVERGLRCAQRLHGVTRARLDVGLLSAAIYADSGRKRSIELETAMDRAIVAAESFGCAAEVASGLTALSHLHFDKDDDGTALQVSLRAESYARGTDPVRALHAIAHSAQCLALLERELPHAEALTAEAARLAAQLGTEVAELHMARGFMQYHRGEIASALPLLERALALAEQADQHWIATLCLTRLAMSTLHAGRLQAALAYCEKLRAVAARMTESSEEPLSAALAAVAGHDLRDPDARGALQVALQRLRALDARTYLAEALCFAAEAELRAGDCATAGQHAQAALDAASAGGRAGLLIWTHALLARAAIASGDLETARAQLAAATPLLASQPYATSLARQHVARAELALAARTR